MDPKVVLVVTWVTAGLVIALYIWFVIWRFRVERRKKAAQAETDSAMSGAIARAAARAAQAEQVQAERAQPTQAQLHPESRETPRPGLAPTPEPVAAPAPIPEPEPVIAPSSTAATTSTVATLLSGIVLPNDLVPLTTIAPRLGVGDRVAFWTDTVPAEIVGPAFADELERLGYSSKPMDDHTLAVQRGEDRLVVMIHAAGRGAMIGDRQAFETVPELSVVIEVWVPDL
jgi:hypothetical protein